MLSFHPRKSITTGEGGMITTNDDSIAKKISVLRDHGANVTDLQRHLGKQPYIMSDHVEAGFNSRMTDIQAALGSSQMNRVKEILLERTKILLCQNRFRSQVRLMSLVIIHFQKLENLYKVYLNVLGAIQIEHLKMVFSFIEIPFKLL